MTKAELRKQRQAEHAARQQARLDTGDTRTAAQRHSDTVTAAARKRRYARRKPHSRTPIYGSAEWAETYSDDIPSLGD